MSYHIVSIDAPTCSLSCKDGQLTCKTDEGTKSLPIEDVAAIVITSFSASIHSKLLLEAAKHGVGLVICENFKPASLVLPANRSTDTLLTRAQVQLKAQTRERLWRKTIDAKCHNQLTLASELACEDRRLEKLALLAKGRAKTKEAETARLFWRIYADNVAETDDFRRGRYEGGPNQSLATVRLSVFRSVATSVLESRQSQQPLCKGFVESVATSVLKDRKLPQH